MQEDKNPTVLQMRFPQKLWYLLNMRTDAILWGGTGRTILLNYRVLHNYLQCDHSIFKTTNISSFVRQLNLYGFRKVTSHLQDPLCNSSNPYMHEYVHDYFQFGRPELLNKIIRKALALRKNFKPKVQDYVASADELCSTTPLQKARRALQIALRKAAQNLILQSGPRELSKMNFDSDDTPEDYCEDEENIDLNWTKNSQSDGDELDEPAAEKEQSAGTMNVNEDSNYGESSHECLISFNDESSQQNNDNFSNQFLSMPGLDAEPEDNSGVELLAEFDIDHDMDQGITRKIDKQMHHDSMNCVLPSITHYHIDDVSMAEKAITNETDQYNDGEWDQMLNDIIINKSSSQEGGTEFKELYSHISRTIDLLNS